VKIIALIVCVLCSTAGCVTQQPDHFYVLAPQPAEAHESAAPIRRQVVLQLTLPSLVDRNEMVVATPNGVAVMEHERWAAPLADLMTTTLRQDLERRRAEVMVLPNGRDAGGAGVALIRIELDIVQLWARRGVEVSIEAQWRVTDSGNHTSLGRDVFAAPLHSDSYAAVAAALSSCVALLADRLVQEIPAG
jgi:uncharacterized lipoprotein YmbA